LSHLHSVGDVTWGHADPCKLAKCNTKM
jgi:hypothetical protein